MFNLFGDYLRYRDGQVRLRSLVALMGELGVSEATVRTVATRMRREGWLLSRREGRETTYELTPASWAVLDEGRTRIFERTTAGWDGQWHLVMYSVPESERPIRETLRKQLAWAGFGPLSAGVWVSPHDRTAEVRDRVDPAAARRLDVFHAKSAGAEADRDIASRAWDMAGLARDYRDLIDRYSPRLDEYRSGRIIGREALAARMELVHDYRVLPFRDPDLPRELQPAQWPGRAAHEVFLEGHGLLRVAAEAHVDTLIM